MEMNKTVENNTRPLSLHPLSLTTSSSREGTSFKSTKVVGLENALNRVTGQGSMLRIIPITGMGGIGKTTLAKASFEASGTRYHFDLRFWITVLRGLLPEAERTKHGDDQLIEYVYKHLNGRRYLIVLDDMWDEKVWDRVRIAFPDDSSRSRVILTTRLSVICWLSESCTRNAVLNKDQSWDLLREMQFLNKHQLVRFPRDTFYPFSNRSNVIRL